MDFRKLSILIPVYNESETILQLLEKVREVEISNAIEKEVIIIDDGSTDQSKELIKAFIEDNHLEHQFNLLSLEKNSGKGAALQEGIARASGEYLVIQDGDLEYDPEEYNNLLAPIFKGQADVVYGSRFKGSNPTRNLYFWHYVGNRLLTFLTNLVTNLNLTDMETCYKVIRTSLLKDLTIREKRFGFEPEVTIKLSRIPKIKFYEIGISYYGRTFEDGKKITWKDGIRALFCIVKYGFFKWK